MGLFNNIFGTGQPAPTVRGTTAKRSGTVSGGGKETITLTKGEVVKGEVTDLRSNEVTVRLEDGRTLHAKLDTAAELAIGQEAEFLVQDSDETLITLKILSDGDTSFTESAIDKALEASGFPKSQNAVSIVRSLLTAGLPANKEMIQKMMQYAAANKDVSHSTLTALLKNNIPVTKVNASQLQAYRNFEHRLLSQASTLTSSLSSALRFGEASPEFATKLFSAFFAEEPGTASGEAPAFSNTLTENGASAANGALAENRAPVANGALAENGALAANGTLAENGALAANGTLAENGAPVANGTVTNGAPTANGALAANGASTANGTFAANGALSANGASAANGALSANGASTANGTFAANEVPAANGASTANGTFAANGAPSANGALSANESLVGKGGLPSDGIPADSKMLAENGAWNAKNTLAGTAREPMSAMSAKEATSMEALLQRADASGKQLEGLTSSMEQLLATPGAVPQPSSAQTANTNPQHAPLSDARQPLSQLLPKEETENLFRILNGLAAANPDEPQLTALANNPGASAASLFAALAAHGREKPASLASLLKKEPAITDLLDKTLLSGFVMKPEDLTQEDSVKKFYEELSRTLAKMADLTKAAENSPALKTAADTAGKMQDNISFMNALNQVFPYVQLPLQMTEQLTHGELYVYTKKKDLSAENKEVSILLHLDMDFLGPTDIHVSLFRQAVNAHFYLPDEETGALVSEHMAELSDALSKKGFTLTASVTKREKEPDIVNDFMGGTEAVPMKRFRFDIRA